VFLRVVIADLGKDRGDDDTSSHMRATSFTDSIDAQDFLEIAVFAPTRVNSMPPRPPFRLVAHPPMRSRDSS